MLRPSAGAQLLCNEMQLATGSRGGDVHQCQKVRKVAVSQQTCSAIAAKGKFGKPQHKHLLNEEMSA